MTVPLKNIVEAALLSVGRSLTEDELASFLPPGVDLLALLTELANDYSDRGVCIVKAAGGWALRTRSEASDLATRLAPDHQKLTRAATETLAVVAAFQPVTRSEIERVRGVQLSPGVIDQLLSAEYIKPGPRRDTPGRPLTWMTTDLFLEAFDLLNPDDIVALRRMKEANLNTLPSLRLPLDALPLAEAVEAEELT